MSQPIEQQWEIFRKKVIPIKASLDQITDMKGAFYAGASCALHEVNKASTLPDDDGCALLDALQNELDGYFISTYGHLQKHYS